MKPEETKAEVVVPFMQLSRAERRRIAKKRKIFKGADRNAWRMLTKHKDKNNG